MERREGGKEGRKEEMAYPSEVLKDLGASGAGQQFNLTKTEG